MEMNTDLFAIQGLLSSAVKKTGEFTKMKFRGGNEAKINLVIKDIEEYLVHKQYFDSKKRTSNRKFFSELETIVLFLTINTDFKTSSLAQMEEFAHVRNIIPTLSTCLLAHIVIELELCLYFCVLIEKLPLEVSDELLSTCVPYVKRAAPKLSLECSYLLLLCVIKKLSCLDHSAVKISEIIDGLNCTASEMLLYIFRVNPDRLQGWSKLKVYKHMGITLLKLLKLLKFCDVENQVLHKIIDLLCSTTCTVVQAVTIKVFCSWAEVQYKGQGLQTAVGEQAYYVIEKYHKFELVGQLIQMLSTFAKKPKTLAEMIREADVTTIIKKIDECDSNQKHWFIALLNTSRVFEDEQSAQCLNTWAKLCTIEDVGRLLNLSVNYKCTGVRKTIISCASYLNENDLILVITRFFHQHGLKSCLDSESVRGDLTHILNKFESGNSESFRKQILLLLLQNPEAVVKQLYVDSLKSAVLLSHLTDFFQQVASLIQIENLSTTILKKVVIDMKPNAKNIGNYETLCKILSEDSFSRNKFIDQMLKGYADDCLKDKSFDDLKYAFRLYMSVTDRANTTQFTLLFCIAVNILEKCRWKFFEFSSIKEDLCEQSLNLVLDYIAYCSTTASLPDVKHIKSLSVDNYLNKYYIAKLNNETDLSFFNYVCPSFNVSDHAGSVCYLIKLLPICVPKEWTYIADYLRYGTNEFLELMTDSLLLISQVAKTQENKENDSQGMACLKYCVQNYGRIIKDALLPLKLSDVDISVTKSVCRLLKEIPASVRVIEGMSLVSLLTEQSLKALVQDRTFVYLLASIGDSSISQVIAKKMLS